MKSKQFNPKPIKKIFLLSLVLLLSVSAAIAQNIKVAVAANLQAVIKVLQKDFKDRTGITIEPIVSSSGNLTAQIKNGAPFDVFLSADMTFPESLYKDGFASKKPATYAFGSLIICSNQNLGFDNWEKLLQSDKVKKIAIANPAIAPYGKVAEMALTNKGILTDIKPKIVQGESISQVNTYITTGVAEVGFTALSLVKDPNNKTPLYYKVIPLKSVAALAQGIIILKRADGNADAKKFFDYIFGDDAHAIFKQFGYLVDTGN